MLKITNTNELDKIHFPDLKAYIWAKIQSLTDEYQITDFDEIGCFVILETNEKELFNESEMEFTETLNLKNETYLHGVKIIGDCYGEDIYLNLEEGKTMFEPNKPNKAEQLEFEMTYILADVKNPVTAKIYVIDSVEYCTMLLAEEY